jgi:hypothetical protein
LSGRLYLFFQTGLRFSITARRPSCTSSRLFSAIPTLSLPKGRDPYSDKPLMAGFQEMLFVLPDGLAFLDNGTQAFLHVFKVH